MFPWVDFLISLEQICSKLNLNSTHIHSSTYFIQYKKQRETIMILLFPMGIRYVSKEFFVKYVTLRRNIWRENSVKYRPGSEKTEADYDYAEFYTELETTLQTIPNWETIILIGPFESKVV